MRERSNRILVPALLAVAVLLLPVLAAVAQRSSGDGSPFSPQRLTQRFEEQAGRSAIPQPGEGFPKALAHATDAPISVLFVEAGRVLPWSRAAEFLGGDTITVEGRIEDTFQVPNGPCLLKFDAKDRKAFYLAAFTDGWAELRDPPAEYYRGRVVRVTGPVTDYRGTPQIKVEDPSQIEIVGAGR